MNDLEQCPICHEDCGYIEFEGGWCVYVECGNCGSHTSYITFKNEEQKRRAEQESIKLWNMGKVVPERRLE